MKRKDPSKAIETPSRRAENFYKRALASFELGQWAEGLDDFDKAVAAALEPGFERIPNFSASDVSKYAERIASAYIERGTARLNKAGVA